MPWAKDSASVPFVGQIDNDGRFKLEIGPEPNVYKTYTAGIVIVGTVDKFADGSKIKFTIKIGKSFKNQVFFFLLMLPCFSIILYVMGGTTICILPFLFLGLSFISTRRTFIRQEKRIANIFQRLSDCKK